MSTYLPPPTYADPVIVDEVTGKSRFNPIWLDWFLRLTAELGTGGVPEHNSLSGLQGGTSSQYYHLTSAQLSALVTVLSDAFVKE